jgi:hypothetical protein
MNDWKKAFYACVITLLAGGLFLGSIIISLQIEKQQQLAERDKQIAELKANAGKPIHANMLPDGNYSRIRSYDENANVYAFVQDEREFGGGIGDDMQTFAIYSPAGKIPNRFVVKNGKIVDSGGVTIENPLK